MLLCELHCRRQIVLCQPNPTVIWDRLCIHHMWQMFDRLSVSVNASAFPIVLVDTGITYCVCLITVTGLEDCSPSSNAVVTRQSAFHVRYYVVIYVFWFVPVSCLNSHVSSTFGIFIADLNTVTRWLTDQEDQHAVELSLCSIIWYSCKSW